MIKQYDKDQLAHSFLSALLSDVLFVVVRQEIKGITLTVLLQVKPVKPVFFAFFSINCGLLRLAIKSVD
jgi:hypothetical protein